MGLILDQLQSFFKSELAQLDICARMKQFIYDPPEKKHQSLPFTRYHHQKNLFYITEKKTIHVQTDKIENGGEAIFSTTMFYCQWKNISNKKRMYEKFSKLLLDNNAVPNNGQYIPLIPSLVSTGHHISTLRVLSVFLSHEESYLPNYLKGKIFLIIKVFDMKFRIIQMFILPFKKNLTSKQYSINHQNFA